MFYEVKIRAMKQIEMLEQPQNNGEILLNTQVNNILSLMGGYENFASMLIEFKEMKRSIQEKDEKIESLQRELTSVRMFMMSQIE